MQSEKTVNIGQCPLALHSVFEAKREPTCKGFLNIHHLPRTRLHEPTPPTPRILQPLPTTDYPTVLQITLVPRHKLDRLHAASIQSVITFHINHLHKIFKSIQGRGSRDVVDEEEGVRFEIRGGPEAPVFFLTGRIGEGEEVGLTVYGARGGVGVLWKVKIRDEKRWESGVKVPIVGSYLSGRHGELRV